MKCPNCFNDIITSSQCKYCPNIFCSLTCLQFHYSNYHNTNNNNNNLRKTIINSPFLIKGILNKTIIYDDIYSLNNFVPILEEDGNIKTIGSGSYGQVYLGLNTITKKYYAIKHMDKKTIYELLHSLEAAKDEIEIQSKIDHPNIVKLLYVKETDISYDLIMEYAPKGNLFHFIRKTRGLTEDISFCLFIQIVNAINFLHENDLIHRDIKPENILIFDNDIVKLCDFGWCVKLDGQQRGTFCGTTEYMSPELVNHEGYGKEIDVWSLGVLLYEMIHGYSPFRPNKPNFNEKDVMENIINHNLNFGKNVSNECKSLIYSLLDPNIHNRYKVEDIYSSEFVRKYEDIQFNFQNNNNQSQNQINNIVYSPQIEMNNNINIHMSMDMKNYVYNIQIPENKINNEHSESDITNAKNLSFSKINKDVYNNYINSVNNYGNSNNISFNNYYLYKNINDSNNINNNSNYMNNELYINNNFNNNSNIEQNKLINNKTWNSTNNEKNSQNEFNDIYTDHTNDALTEDSNRDNKNFINFNNSIFYFPGHNKINNIFYNNINLNNNNLYNNYNSNIQLNNNINNQYIQISRTKKEKGNSMDIINEQNTFNNNNISDLNFYNSHRLMNNYHNNCFSSIQASLMKRTPIDFNNNVNLENLNTKNGIEKDKIKKENNYNHSQQLDEKKYLWKSDIFFPKNEKKLGNLNKKDREPIDNIIGRKLNNEKLISKGIMYFKNNSGIINHTYRLNYKNEGITKIKPNKLQKKISGYTKDINENNKINKLKEFKKGVTSIYKNTNFDQPKEALLKNIELNKKQQLQKSKSFHEKEKVIKNKNLKNQRNINDFNHRINLTERKENKNQKITSYFDKQNNNHKNNTKIIKEIKENNKKKTDIKNDAQLDKSNSEISCSLFNVLSSKRKDKKINNNKSNISNIKSHSKVNDISKESGLTSKGNDKKIINSKKNNGNNVNNNNIMPECPNIKIKLKKNKNVSFNRYLEQTPNSKLIIKKNESKEKSKVKSSDIDFDKNNSETNKMKYLKINKTTDENRILMNNRVNAINLNKNEKGVLNKQILNVVINDNYKVLKPSFSYRIINNEGNIKSNRLHINKIKNNKKIYIDEPNDIKFKNKRKYNNKNYTTSIKETESNIISNTSDFSDTIDERNVTPKKSHFFNRIKPNKLIEAFKKELAQNFLNIKKSINK